MRPKLEKAAPPPARRPDPFALFERVNTKTCPLEFTATPGTSPKFIPGGSLMKSGTESNGISGTSFCANAAGAANNTITHATADAAAHNVFIAPSFTPRSNALEISCRP